MTSRLQIAAQSFSEALYLIETLVELNAEQSDLRTALMLNEDNLTDEEAGELHHLIDSRKKY